MQAIATARAFGDLSENFEYHAAKNEQGLLERRIAILRHRVENAIVVEEAEDGVVGVGSVVEVEDESGARFEVEISSVGGGISTESPLGSALVGAQVGDSVQVEAPKGSWTARRLGPLGRLVEAALGLVEALARERLDRVGRGGDQRLGVLVGREGAEHVVRDRTAVAAAGSADAARATRRNSAEPSACLIERRPLWPARPPPSRTWILPGSRSTSSWTTAICSVGSLKKRAAAASELPERFMYVSGFRSASFRSSTRISASWPENLERKEPS